ncbi:MAG TPA: GNAT family N-acetyltransferase [Bacteroidia bacterium]|nr:GNAT family N-acetyltransferase [Bacteroidia bacterium]
MISLNFSPFPLLETERLYLRAITEDDKHEMFALRSDKQIMQYIARPLMTTIEEITEFIKSINSSIEKQEYINWGIALKNNNKLIGTVGFYRMAKENYRAEVGYMLHTNFHKQGIMQELMPVVLEYGFKQMNLHSIEAVIDPRNKDSENVLLKQGFVKEAHFKENFFFDGEFLDSVHYSLLAKK